MKNLLCGFFLIFLTQCAIRFRINTQQTTRLTPNDKLVSTLGYFRMGLHKSGCLLTIQMFDKAASNYLTKGNYSSDIYSGNCEYLQVEEGKVTTDSGMDYIRVNSSSSNYSTIMTIDDEGVIRVIATHIGANRVNIFSEETVIDKFKIEQKYIRAYSNLDVDFTTRINPVANERRWKFIAEFGQLTIYYGDNPALKHDYVFSFISIKNSRIYDFSDRSFPASIFNNITFAPRCAEPRIYLEFKPPFVFTIDPYWPVVTLYEQGGYKVIEIPYYDVPQYDFDQDIREVNYHHFDSPCPRRTFEHLGDCVARCPSPYYHQIKGQTGWCVLTCEEFASVDELNRICSCVTDYEKPKLSLSDLVIGCPYNATKTPYGCVCKSNQEFYDGLLSFKCVQSNSFQNLACPSGTIALNGLCMLCSFRCKTCQRDNYHRRYLQCIECESGYHLDRGLCVKTCQNNYGLSLVNGICEKCDDVNCVDCSQDPKVCLRCSILTSLENGSCKDNCTIPAQFVYSEYFDTQCVNPVDTTCFTFLKSHYKNIPFLKCDQCFPGQLAHLDKCVATCPPGYVPHIEQYCTCAGNLLTINDQCVDLPGCPITMYFDIRSHSCLSCPFGCMSCINSQCIACNPGYFLYISPQSILCRKKSPLFPCDGQYSWQRGTTCLVTNYTNPSLQMAECIFSIPNCQVCIPGNNQICVLCLENFYIYNNTCIQNCPPGLIPYDNTCILPQIGNCAVPHLQSLHQSELVTLKKIQASESYTHYIYDGQEAVNDPVGYIPVFQDLTSRTNDGLPRQTSFFEVQWICLKCEDGFGLAEDFKSCSPCPNSCSKKLCYMARSDSCLMPSNGSNGQNENSGPCVVDQFVDSETGRCLNSCKDNNKFPEVEMGKLTCKPIESSVTKNYLKIDSAIYPQSDGSNIVFFVISQKISQSREKLGVNYLGGVKKVKFVSQTNTGQSQNLPLEEKIRDGQYIFIDQGPYDTTFGAYEINLSGKLAKLRSAGNDGAIFPNKVYGSIKGQDHTAFMKTWLAYIGYIMSITIILLHAVYIGNELLYKVDNLLIFVQSIYYFSFAKNLVGHLLAQFYYGWFYAHAGFLPNIFSAEIPPHYVELSAPISFKLVNTDGNYFRNAGFSLGWLLIFVACWCLLTALAWGVGYRFLKRKEVWYPQVAKLTLIGVFEFFSMNLMFFSVTQLAYGYDHSSGHESFFSSSQGMAIFTIIFLIGYTVVRINYEPLGGVFMIKRLLLAIFLAFAFDHLLILLGVVFLQILFGIVCLLVDFPEQHMGKLTIFIEGLVLIGSYLLLFLCLDTGVNSVIISIVVFLFIVYLAFDLALIYLQSRDEYAEDQLSQDYEELNLLKGEKATALNTGIFLRQQSSIKNPETSIMAAHHH